MYIRMNKGKDRFQFDRGFLVPFYADRYHSAGSQEPYFWQDLWAAQLVAKNNPKKHYDIGSRIDGFIAHLASFRENIFVFDLRPPTIWIR